MVVAIFRLYLSPLDEELCMKILKRILILKFFNLN